MIFAPRIIAAIDIGTNSIHMVVAKVSDSGFEVIAREKDNTRLGEGGGDMKMLSAEAMERGIEALRHMRRVADAHRASVFAVASSIAALRSLFRAIRIAGCNVAVAAASTAANNSSV